VAAVVVVGLRILVAGEGDPGRLVLLGRTFATPGYRFAIPVRPGTGYDGEFYYRMALGPFHFGRTWSGITLDTDARFNRMVYSVLAWLVSGGQHSLVPWSLIAVNVVGIGVLGWLTAGVARSYGQGVWWGLLIPAYCGFLYSLGRDLTEIVESAFVVAGLVALRRRHALWAGLLLAAAVLTRETAMGFVAALAAVDLASRVPSLASWLRRHGRLVEDRATVAIWAWLVPVVAFVGWQLVVRAETGSVPLFDSGQSNLGTPFVGLVHGFRHYLAAFPGRASLFWFAELFLLVVVVGLAARALRTSTAPGYVRLAFGVYVVMAVSLAKPIWLGDVGFRSLEDVYVVSCLVLLSSRRLSLARATRYLPVLSTMVWCVVAAQVIKDI
jgi:hypothetical protein